MRKAVKRTKNTFVNGILLMGLVGVMIAYLAVIGGDMATHLYTPDQYEYLSYNRGRVLSQAAPVWNLLSDGRAVGQEGAAEGLLLSDGQAVASLLSGIASLVLGIVGGLVSGMWTLFVSTLVVLLVVWLVVALLRRRRVKAV